MKYPDDFINKIICGSCLEIMKGIPDNCVDTIITDPPYGIGFMGKEWDVFKSDFVRKSVEKSNRNTVKIDGMASKSAIRYDESLLGHQKYQDWCVEWMKECLRVSKPGATFLCCGSPRVYHHIALATERAGWIIKDCVMWLYGSGFPKASDISKQIDKKAKKERKIIGEKTTPDGKLMSARTPNSKDDYHPSHNVMSGATKHNIYITAPATPEATLWNGWKSHGLKPAYEPILVAMKPNEGDYANNALKRGVAGLNIDGGRIAAKQDYFDTERFNNRKTLGGYGSGSIHKPFKPAKGRYPANVILDEEAGQLLDEQSGVLKSGDLLPGHKRGDGTGNSFMGGGGIIKGKYGGDSGGASRFFYCAKASKAERNRGCEGLPLGDAPATGRSKPAEGRTSPLGKPRQNNHPTVKPLSLMRYLCTLTNTPTGGIVLDPFCGSGTTLMACKELKRDYIGIDNVPEYCEIARRRINAIPELLF